MNTIRLPKPDIFSFSECLNFLDRGYDDCLYSIESDRVIKSLQVDGNQLLIEVKEEGNVLEVGILAGVGASSIRNKAAGYVSAWFDLERDLTPFYQKLDHHDRLSWMTDWYHGLRLMGIPDLFRLYVGA